MDINLPFHRKYRPKLFSEYIGNDNIKKSVLTVMRGTQRPQVILMTGHAGTGKTTMARLLAKEYMCENRDPIVGACGKCLNCELNDEYIETGNTGSIMNLQEIDVTDNNKRQDIDNLLEEASLPSYDGGWKIFILDECHMMTNTAQNRLLKNLEEPAENVLMVLCTTDPQKLLETIISRCQYVYKVEKPNREQLGGLLAKVCKKEGVKYDTKGLSLVCVKGDFVPRKTLVALEQVVREKKDVYYENAVEVLNVVGDTYFFEFYRLLLDAHMDINKYIAFLGKLKMTMDLGQFVDSLIGFTLRGIHIAAGTNVEALDKSEITQYKRLFAEFTPADMASLLSRLDSMKRSLDIELKLFLLGYEGLRATTVASPVAPTTALVDTTVTTPEEEKRHGDRVRNDAKRMTDDEKQAFIENNSKPVSPIDLASMFGGAVVIGLPDESNG